MWALEQNHRAAGSVLGVKTSTKPRWPRQGRRPSATSTIALSRWRFSRGHCSSSCWSTWGWWRCSLANGFWRYISFSVTSFLEFLNYHRPFGFVDTKDEPKQQERDSGPGSRGLLTSSVEGFRSCLCPRCLRSMPLRRTRPRASIYSGGVRCDSCKVELMGDLMVSNFKDVSTMLWICWSIPSNETKVKTEMEMAGDCHETSEIAFCHCSRCWFDLCRQCAYKEMREVWWGEEWSGAKRQAECVEWISCRFLQLSQACFARVCCVFSFFLYAELWSSTEVPTQKKAPLGQAWAGVAARTELNRP